MYTDKDGHYKEWGHYGPQEHYDPWEEDDMEHWNIEAWKSKNPDLE